MKALLACLLVGIICACVVAACGGGKDTLDAELSVTGLIVDVKARSVTEYDSITVRTDSGEIFEFRPAPDAPPDPTGGSAPGHLRVHAATGLPVKVFYREEGGKLLAVRIVDAQPALQPTP